MGVNIRGQLVGMLRLEVGRSKTFGTFDGGVSDFTHAWTATVAGDVFADRWSLGNVLDSMRFRS